jgi:hypothetical protein
MSRLNTTDRNTLIGLAAHYRDEKEDDLAEMCDAALKGDRESLNWVLYELSIRSVPRYCVDAHLLRLGLV